MYAICPNCGKSIEDLGKDQYFLCDNCSEKIRSRTYQTNSYQNSEITNRQNTYGPTHSNYPSFSKAIFNLLTSIGVVTFIIVLIINFIAYFPAVAITIPELLAEQQHELETEVQLEIDNTPPKIEIIGTDNQTVLEGQIVEIYIKIYDDNFKICYLENVSNMSGNYKIYNFYYDKNSDSFKTCFQVSNEPGIKELRIVAVDFANNVRIRLYRLIINENPLPYLEILSPEQISYLNPSNNINFKSWSKKIDNVSYSLNTDNRSIELTEGDPIITGTWPLGVNKLFIRSLSGAGNITYQNLSIFIDNEPPIIEFDRINPLTKNRNETFQGRLLNNRTFYRGEFIEIRVNITEESLVRAYVQFSNNESIEHELVPNNIIQNLHNNKGKTAMEKIPLKCIITMPTIPGSYKFKIIAIDTAGNSNIKTYNFKVARINFDYYPVPIMALNNMLNEHIALPVINNNSKLSLNLEFGEIERIKYTYIEDSDDVISIILPNLENISFASLPESQGNISIKIQVTFQFWDILFITFPYPPYLFPLPVILIGWSLVLFFIIVALSIIFSNLHLFKTSLKDAFKWIINPVKNPQNSISKSNNTLILIAQLFFIAFGFSVIYNIILRFFSVSTHVPDFSSLSLWALIYNLTSAAVYEEVISRTILIGIPLVIIHSFMGKVKKQKWRYILGGEFETNKLTIILIIFSSITFGLAHAPGWDYWKVLPSLVSGLVLGYLFVKKGIYASIILHFTINFLSIPLDLTENPPCGVILYGLMLYFWIVLGAIYIIYYMVQIGKKISN